MYEYKEYQRNVLKTKEYGQNNGGGNREKKINKEVF